MNTLKLFVASIFLCLCSCTGQDFLEKVTISEQTGESVSMLKAKNHSFNVSDVMVKNYLRLFHKNKTVERLEPVIKNSDTLAYFVQFGHNKGWGFISADSRVAPLIAYSEEGVFSLSDSDNNHLVKSILELMNQKKCKRSDSETSINSTWAFLYPNSLNNKVVKTKALRGNSVGMWIPQDTTIQEVSQVSAKLTSSKWHQGFPWNIYAPKKGDKSCLLGCGPVAVGQLLYKYIASNPGGNTIPTNAVVPDNGGSVVFSNFSTSGWANLVPRYIVTGDNEQVGVFLSWLGSHDKLHTSYDTTLSTTGWDKTTEVLDQYLNYRNGFHVGEGSQSIIQRNRFCDTIINSIFSGSPVLIITKQHSGYVPHAFLIDKCSIVETQYVIRYVFDPEHRVTDDEVYTYPGWMFEWPGPSYNYDPIYGMAEMEMSTPLTNDLRVQMNWGFAESNYNDVYYLLRSRSYSIYGDGLINEALFLTWTLGSDTYGDINHWAHHFSRKITE